MASLSKQPNSKGQVWVTWYWGGAENRFQDCFPESELPEAKAHLKLVEREVEKSRKQGKPTAFIQTRLDAKQARRQNRKGKTDIARIAEFIENNTPQLTSKTAEEIYAAYLDVVKVDRKPLTICQYEESWKFFREHCDKRYLSDVNADDILSFQNALKKKGQKPNTINKHIRTVKAVFNYAIKREFIIKSPFVTINKLKPEIKAEPFLYPDEVETLLECARETGRDIHLFCGLCYYTGARRNEAQRIRWSNAENLDSVLNPNLETAINRHMTKERKKQLEKAIATFIEDGFDTFPTTQEELTARLADINPELKQWVQTPQASFYLPDRKKGYFTHIPMLPQLIELLREYADDRGKYPTDYIINPTRLDSEVRNVKQIRWIGYRKQFEKVLEKAKLTQVVRHGQRLQVTPHTLRYSFASLLLTAGLNPDIVSRYSQHTTEEMHKHYSYMMLGKEGIMTEAEATAIRKTFNPYAVAA